MKKKFRHSSIKLWCLVGLSGVSLSAALLLGEGQARTLTTASPHPSIRIHDSLASDSGYKKSHSGKNHDRQPEGIISSTGPGLQEMENDEKPNKKRLGLAILFLGVLAEKS